MPTELATDDFTGTNGDPLSSSWTHNGLGSASAPTIQTNAAQGGGSSTRNGSWWNADTFDSDQYSQATHTADRDLGGVAVRMAETGSSSDFYWGGAYGAFGAYIEVVVNGTPTSVAYESGNVIATGSVIRLEVSGSDLELFDDGVSVASNPNGSLSSGSAGLSFFTTETFDDWSGGDMAAGGTTYNETVGLSAAAAATNLNTAILGASLSMSVEAVQADGAANAMAGLVSLSGAAAVSVVPAAVRQAVTNLSMAAAVAWADALTKDELVALSAQVSLVNTSTATMSAVATLLSNLTLMPGGTLQMAQTVALSADAGATWAETVGEVIAIVALAAEAGLTPATQADLAAALSLSLQATLAAQAQATMAALLGLGVNAATAQVAGLALTEAVALNMQAALVAAGATSSATIGLILKRVAEQIKTATITGTLRTMDPGNETLETE